MQSAQRGFNSVIQNLEGLRVRIIASVLVKTPRINIQTRPTSFLSGRSGKLVMFKFTSNTNRKMISKRVGPTNATRGMASKARGQRVELGRHKVWENIQNAINRTGDKVEFNHKFRLHCTVAGARRCNIVVAGPCSSSLSSFQLQLHREQIRHLQYHR